MASGRVLFYVQHLLGIGHLKRAATVVRALQEAGLEVTLVSGGPPVPGLEVGGARMVQLDPVRAGDLYFKVLLDASGQAVDDEFRRRRRDRLLAIFAALRPQLVVTELFPFGRRQLRSELLPLIEAAWAMQPRPALVSSVRDILVQPPKPERVTEMVDLADRWYDLVLVHGDPTLIPFERTFPLADRLRGRIRYTGYVVDPPPMNAGSAGTGEVVVSAGGGAVSEPLLAAALEARAMTRLADVPWRLLAGPSLDDDAVARLRAAAPVGVTIERARPDFTTLLANCTLSISQGGYNTVMEVLATRCRAVVVPYAGGLETEQTLRARLLAGRGALTVVDESALSPATLAAAVEAALSGPRPDAAGLDTGGAAATARMLSALASSRAGTAA